MWSKPLLWVLYTGYAWLIAGFALTAAAAGGLVWPSLPAHAFTAGGIGVLTLGMMVRVTLGHTGRALEPGRVLGWSFVLMNAGALVRVVLPVAFPSAYQAWISLAGGLWCLALTLFVVVLAPMLCNARIDGKPG